MGLHSPTHIAIFVALCCCCCLPLVSCQAQLTVSVIEAEGFCEFDESVKEWVGFIPDILKQLGAVAKPPFTVKLKSVADGRYGRFEESTKTWSGLIGEVISKKCDMAAAPLTLTAQREEHIDFTHELLDVGLVTLARPIVAASPVTRSAAFFLRVFDFGVWVCVLLVFFVTAVLLFLNAIYNPREQQQQQQQQQQLQQPGLSLGAALQDSSEFSVLNSLLFAISTACFQGYRKMPQSLAGRCVSVTWWIFCAIFATTYMAGLLCGLVASRGGLSNRMATQDARTQFSNSEAAFDSLVPIWLPGGSTDKILRDSADPLLRRFHRLNLDFRKRDDRLNKVTTIKDLVELVKADAKFFAILESEMALLIARRSGCQLQVGSSLLTDKSYGFALAENSNWTEVMNQGILQLRESGRVQEVYARHFGAADSRCSSPSRPAALDFVAEELASVFRDSLPIGLDTFAGPIVFYCCGLLLAVLAALADVFVFTRYERYQRGTHQTMPNVDEQQDAGFGTLAFNDDREPVVDRLHA